MYDGSDSARITILRGQPLQEAQIHSQSPHYLTKSPEKYSIEFPSGGPLLVI